MTFFQTTSPFWLAFFLISIETLLFYHWHWPHRQLLPKRFRTFLLVKGVLKSIVQLLVIMVSIYFSYGLGWLALAITLSMGLIYHYKWCVKNGVNPLTVQPRENYVQATADWVNSLIEKEKRLKDKKRHDK